ncbi:MAG TPA: hypothetical protein VD838_02935 [Anaeromyxobacteraceae bacterium]|nr:hypothetical protein [Anaeromyxobacteraceae bacterium]
MLVVVIAMLVVLAVAGLVVVYVAYPHRGEELPAAPWLGEAMNRAAGAAPVLEPEYEDSESRH